MSKQEKNGKVNTNDFITIISEKRKKALEDSSLSYLTLITISISLALGYFCQEIKIGFLFGSEASLVYWLQCLSILQLLVLVWYEYMLGTILFKWILNHIDVFFIFILTILIFQLVKIYERNLEAYFLMFGVFFFLAIVGHLHQYIQSHKFTENNEILVLLGKTHYVLIASELLSLLFCIGSYFILIQNLSDTNNSSIFLVLVLNVILFVFMIGSYLFIWKKVFLLRKNSSNVI